MLWLGAAPAYAGEIPRPDLRLLEADVREALLQIREKADARLKKSALSPLERAETLAGLGLSYQAHLILDPAAAAFRAAEQIDASDYRWPYHLGHASAQAGRLKEAEQAYARSLGLKPESGLVRLRLARVYLKLGRADLAKPLLQKAAEYPDLRAVAMFELGKAEAALGQQQRAVEYFQRALKMDPAADRIHYPLALSYRSLGQMQLARTHLSKRGAVEPAFSDPLTDVLQQLSTGQRMLYNSGLNAAQRGDFKAAADLFRQGLEADAHNANAHISLARFDYLSGDSAGAESGLRKALELAPDSTLAGMLLAVLLEQQGRVDESEQQFRQTLRQSPGHAGASYLFANLLMRKGEYLQAEQMYGLALQTGEAPPPSWFWRILAAIRAELAPDRLTDLLKQAVREQADDPQLSYLLASWLSASPHEASRDGEQALRLAENMADRYASPDNLALLAAAQAEAGDFAAAVETQQRVVGMFRDSFNWPILAEAESRLEDYRQGRPNRQPWPQTMLMQAWPAMDAEPVFKSYPPDEPF